MVRLLNTLFCKDCAPVNQNQHNAFNELTVSYGMTKLVADPGSVPERAFRKFDLNGDGFLSWEEFVQVSQNSTTTIYLLKI